ncbi:MAG: hypothetical protein QG650_651, partial [Patescibacteria group bacterium]|nr:hypothetical protein [Patescibacteria group bacterium]
MILSSDFADRIARAEKYLTDRASKEVSRQYAYNHEAGKIGSKIAEYAYLPSRIEALEKEIAKIECSFERLGYYYVFTPEDDLYFRKISKTPIQEN